MAEQLRVLFRFYGDLRVVEPGVPDTHLPHGVLDVIDARSRTQPMTSQTILRWRPAAIGTDDDDKLVSLSTPLLNWHGDRDAVRKALDEISTVPPSSFSFVVSEPDNAGSTYTDGPRLLHLEGITAMDRMTPDPTGTGRIQPDLRIPCVQPRQGNRPAYLRIGQDFEGKRKYVYTYRVHIPIPAGFSASTTASRPYLPLYAEHTSSTTDVDLLQRPYRVYSPEFPSNTGQQINHDLSNGGKRFGEFTILHRVSNDDTTGKIKLPDGLRVRADELLNELRFVGTGARPGSPGTGDYARHQIILGKAENGLGLRVTTLSSVTPTELRLAPQLSTALTARSNLRVRADFEITATQDQVLRPNAAAPFECDGRLWIRLDAKQPTEALKLNAAQTWMAEERQALLVTKGEPQSFLPHLHFYQPQGTVALHVATRIRARMPSGGGPRFERDPAYGPDIPVAVTLADEPLTQADHDLSVGVSFPGIEPEAATNNAHDYHLKLKSFPDVLRDAHQPVRSALRFQVINHDKTADTSGSHQTGFSGRLGSLAFAGASRNAGVKLLADAGTFDIRPNGDGPGRPAAKITLPIALEDVRPVTSDRPRGDRDTLREDWLIPAATPHEPRPGDDDDDTTTREARFVLKVEESLGVEFDHHLTASLSENAPDRLQGFDDVLVTRAPFAMMRLRRPSLDDLASAATSEIAVYDSDSQVWQFRAGGDLIPISFPASATGESMDKPGRRSISDGAATDIVRSRLSGPATAWVDTSATGRAFRTPEHNARALFDDRGEDGPGAELAGFTAELVYGVAAAWERPANTTALTSVVRLTETGALMGRTMGNRSGDGAGTPSSLTETWPQLRQAVAERPQHIEAVSRLAGVRPAYTAATFTKDLTFAARCTAVIAPPTDGLEQFMSPEAIADPVAARRGPKVRPYGLDGGAFWGIEQRSFVERILLKPESNLGQIEGLAFGPFGTTGAQTVRFVNGSLAIITESQLGRLSSLQIEVNGRIGAFYHRAKHVVVYRRTTAASDQFEGLGGDSRRPILRKVEEYIELQDQTRTYPDRPNADPRSCGPLRELRFGATRINVDSAWAETVGKDGWRVPLWNRHAANVRPVVYPKPGVTVALQGEDDERLTLQALRDPNKLCFYTNGVYAEQERDPTLWPAVHGVDGLDIANLDAWAKAQDERARTKIDDEKEGILNRNRRAAASRFVPGAGSFTHCLSPSTALTKVNEARGAQPVFATLESFAFLRGGGRSVDESGKTPTDSLAQLDDMADFLDTLGVPTVDTENLPSPVKTAAKKVSENLHEFKRLAALVADNKLDERITGEVLEAFQTFKQNYNIETLQERLTEQALAELAKILDENKWCELKTVLDERKPKTLADLLDAEALAAYETALTDQMTVIGTLGDTDAETLKTAIFGNKLDAFQAVFQKDPAALERLKELLDADTAKCTALADEAAAAVAGKKLLYRQQLASIAGEARSIVDTATAQSLKDEIDTLKRTALAGVDDGTKRVGEAFGKINAQVADARALVADWATELDRAYASGLERVAAFRAAYDADKPWSPKRLDTMAATLATELANLTSEATAALAQTRQRMAAELNAQAADATALIDRSLQQARKVLDSGHPVVGIAGLLLGRSDDALSLLRDALDDIRLAPLLTRLQDAINAETNAGRKSALEAAKAEMMRLRDQGRALANKTADQADKGADALQADVTRYGAAASKLVADVKAGSGEALAGLEAGLRADLERLFSDVDVAFAELRTALDELVQSAGVETLDELVLEAETWIKTRSSQVQGLADSALKKLDGWLLTVQRDLNTGATKLTHGLNKALKDELILPLFDGLLGAIPDPIPDLQDLRQQLHAAIAVFEDGLDAGLDRLDAISTTLITEAEDLCRALVQQKQALIDALENGVKAFVHTSLNNHLKQLNGLSNAIAAGVADAGDALEDAAQALGNAATRALTAFAREAESIAETLAEAGQELFDDVARLVSVGGRIPDIGGLGINSDRILAVFKDLSPDIDMSSVVSQLQRLGDSLGAFKFDLPVDGMGDGFNLPDLDDMLPNLNLERFLPDIGGLNFKDLAPDFGGDLKNVSQYIKITHDIDKRAKTAWAKADLNLPLPNRAKLFGLGPFSLFLNKPKLIAWVRIEANSKTKDVTTTEHGEVRSDIEAVVAGQPMVTLRDVTITYTEADGLDVDVDPSKIKLHPNFQFIQDVLDGLGLDFGDNGISVLKNDDGIPVGVEHKLTLPVPPVSAGTSGVTDLTIANAFQLKAYPDFYISNRFNLSTRERPFVFAIFILGCTGFVQVDVKHLPTDGTTAVTVQAGVGGSASLSFALGPVSGGVFVTLTVILTYRAYLPKTTDQTDAGLSIGLELALYGYVSLWGIATIMLRLALSLTYHESGRIDANGRLSVEVRVSRFFKLKYRTNVTYRVRDGKSVTIAESNTGYELDDGLKQRAANLKKARARLT